MKKILYTAMLLSFMAGRSQTFEWLETPDINLNLNPDMVSYCVAHDPSGNVYLSGFKDGATPYNDIMGSLYYNKYDSNGQLLFSKEIGGKAHAYNMVPDSQGNMIVALGYIETITIDGITISTIEQGDHFVLAKFDPQGNLLWHKLIISPEEFTWTSELKAVDTDAQDNIYIGYDSFGTSHIDKYSPDGNKLLEIVQEHANRITSLSVDTAGNIFAAGSCADNMATFAGETVPSPFQYNTYIVKYSPLGVFQWVNYVDDITCPSPQVVAHSPNEIYFSSNLFGASTFGPFTAEGPTDSSEDFFLARLSAVGTYVWVREVPGDGKVEPGKRNYLDVDNDGNIYFTGHTGGNIDWGNGITTSTPWSGYSALVLKYSPDGTVLMAKTAGGDGYTRTDGISVNDSGDIYLSGMSSGQTAFDSLVYGPGETLYYPYLTKISSAVMGTPDHTTISVPLYPNPATDQITLSGLDRNVSGVIINMLGQTVGNFETDGTSAIPVRQLTAGTYFIKAEGLPTLKFIKN